MYGGEPSHGMKSYPNSVQVREVTEVMQVRHTFTIVEMSKKLFFQLLTTGNPKAS
jgi:hypothetical protein